MLHQHGGMLATWAAPKCNLWSGRFANWNSQNHREGGNLRTTEAPAMYFVFWPEAMRRPGVLLQKAVCARQIRLHQMGMQSWHFGRVIPQKAA